MPVANDWSEPENRKKFFDEFAAQRKFDPLIPKNWNTFATKDVLSVKVLQVLLMDLH